VSDQSSTIVPRGYPRAPITEAVIALQFAEPLDEETCNKIKAKLQDEYPLINDWFETAVSFDALKKAAEVKETGKGFRLATLDQTEVAVVANTGLTVSRLAPYTGWEAFRERAVRNWKVYRGIAKYRKIRRIGVRYINRIDIPLKESTQVELSDYFRFNLQVSQPPFPTMGPYMIQAVFALPDCMVVVNNGTVPSPLLNHASYVLDLDFGREVNVPQTDDEIWTYVDNIRERKNMLFEACITDRARELFQK
jgi:uncharacterized protein (TIGR04255 family)